MERISHYRLVSRLGKGAMGEVWRAVDERLGRPVALKLLPVARASEQNMQARLLREAQAASALNHPGIVTVHDVGSWHGQIFMVMELVDGEPLSELARRGDGAGGGAAPGGRGGRGAGGGARARHPASRRQGRQLDAHARWAPQGARLRAGEAARAAGWRRGGGSGVVGGRRQRAARRCRIWRQWRRRSIRRRSRAHRRSRARRLRPMGRRANPDALRALHGAGEARRTRFRRCRRCRRRRRRA